MTRIVELSKVEQALVNEINAGFEQASAELRAMVDHKLAVVLEAHGLLGQPCRVTRDGGVWQLIAPDLRPDVDPDAPPVNDG